MQRWRFPINKGTLNLIKMWKISSRRGCLTQKQLVSKHFSIFSYNCNKWVIHFCGENANENKQFKELKTWISDLYLIREGGVAAPRILELLPWFRSIYENVSDLL